MCSPEACLPSSEAMTGFWPTVILAPARPAIFAAYEPGRCQDRLGIIPSAVTQGVNAADNCKTQATRDPALVSLATPVGLLAPAPMWRLPVRAQVCCAFAGGV